LYNLLLFFNVVVYFVCLYIRSEVKIESSSHVIKPKANVWINKRFKKHINFDFVNAMKETPFGTTFMAFYSENFGVDKGMKSNISVLNIVNQYDRDSRSFERQKNLVNNRVWPSRLVYLSTMPISLWIKPVLWRTRVLLNTILRMLRRSKKSPLKRL